MNYTPYIEGIKKTGFPLEHKVAMLLRERGWRVMTNRFYVDKDEERPREVDILAYLYSNKNSDFDLFTTVILSCKKSEHSTWGFLARNSVKDANNDKSPFHYFSSSPAFKFMYQAEDDWAKTYYNEVLKSNVSDIFSEQDVEIFALHELSNGTSDKSKPLGKPLGDSAMFASVMSLMKAQHYEINARNKRKRSKPAIYQFNLLSVVDGEMLEFRFENDSSISAKQIAFTDYMAQYIFNDEQTFSKVFFSKYSNLAHALEQYEKLHFENSRIFSNVVEDFYRNIVEDYQKRKIFEKDAIEYINTRIRRLYARERRAYTNAKIESIFFYKKEDTLEIGVENGLELQFLNEHCIQIAIDAAKIFYKYDGNIKFDRTIPF